MRSNRIPASGDGAIPRDLPASYDRELLYIIARDPKSLFIYWDLNWTQLFARARLSARQVRLRIYRQDGSVEGTHEINPFRGHCYADVASAGTGYYCELGCFEDDEWASLVRSSKAVTPADSMSEDMSAQFATLPIHLSFQRLLDIFRASKAKGATLARSVAELQENARVLQATVTPDEWSRLVATAAARNGTNGATSPDVSTLLQGTHAPTPTGEELAQWKKVGEQLGGASWGGASATGFGGSSPA